MCQSLRNSFYDICVKRIWSLINFSGRISLLNWVYSIYEENSIFDQLLLIWWHFLPVHQTTVIRFSDEAVIFKLVILQVDVTFVDFAVGKQHLQAWSLIVQVLHFLWIIEILLDRLNFIGLARRRVYYGELFTFQELWWQFSCLIDHLGSRILFFWSFVALFVEPYHHGFYCLFSSFFFYHFFQLCFGFFFTLFLKFLFWQLFWLFLLFFTTVIYVYIVDIVIFVVFVRARYSLEEGLNIDNVPFKSPLIFDGRLLL